MSRKIKRNDKVRVVEVFTYDDWVCTPAGTEGHVLGVRAAADYASGFEVNWRSTKGVEHKCCASLLEVI